MDTKNDFRLEVNLKMNMCFEFLNHLVKSHQRGPGWESIMKQNIIDGCILTQAGVQIDDSGFISDLLGRERHRVNINLKTL